MGVTCVQIEKGGGEGKEKGVFVVVIVNFKKTKQTASSYPKEFPDPGSPNKLKFIENAFKK